MKIVRIKEPDLVMSMLDCYKTEGEFGTEKDYRRVKDAIANLKNDLEGGLDELDLIRIQHILRGYVDDLETTDWTGAKEESRERIEKGVKETKAILHKIKSFQNKS